MSTLKDPIQLKGDAADALIDFKSKMQKAGLQAITIGYSGSGDSGDYEPALIAKFNKKNNEWEATKEKAPSEVCDAAAELVEKINQPDFNNDGCSGEMAIYIEKGEVKMSGNHYEYYTESNETSYEDVKLTV